MCRSIHTPSNAAGVDRGPTAIGPDGAVGVVGGGEGVWRGVIKTLLPISHVSVGAKSLPNFPARDLKTPPIPPDTPLVPQRCDYHSLDMTG